MWVPAGHRQREEQREAIEAEREREVALREIERIIDKNTRTLEMHGTDPKSGKEYKMMDMKLTRSRGVRTS